MGGGGAAGGVRRAGVGGVGRGDAEVGRIVPVSAGDLWFGEVGAADFVFVYLAGVVFSAAVDRDRVHRAGGVCGVLLAGVGDGIRASHGGGAYSVGWDDAGGLDRHAGDGGGRGDLFFYGVAAVSTDYGDRATVEDFVVWGDGDDWVDHLCGAYPF